MDTSSIQSLRSASVQTSSKLAEQQQNYCANQISIDNLKTNTDSYTQKALKEFIGNSNIELEEKMLDEIEAYIYYLVKINNLSFFVYADLIL